jgi:hypothetical protein
VDHSNLPQGARDLIEVAEIQAKSIFEACKENCESLLQQAREAGVDPSGIGFSPGRPALEAAYDLAPQCPTRAAGYLFKTTALVYWNHVLKPDVTAFIEVLESIWTWAHTSFGLQLAMPNVTERNWRVWALQERAANSTSQTEQPVVANRMTSSTAKPVPPAAPEGTQLSLGLAVSHWSDLEIRFFSEHSAQLTVGSTSLIREYGSLGMSNSKTGKPNLAWQTLHALALSNGVLVRPVQMGSKWTSVEKRMQELRGWLRANFALSTDPLPFQKSVGYRAEFRIGCAPSYKR